MDKFTSEFQSPAMESNPSESPRDARRRQRQEAHSRSASFTTPSENFDQFRSTNEISELGLAGTSALKQNRRADRSELHIKASSSVPSSPEPIFYDGDFDTDGNNDSRRQSRSLSRSPSRERRRSQPRRTSKERKDLSEKIRKSSQDVRVDLIAASSDAAVPPQPPPLPPNSYLDGYTSKTSSNVLKKSGGKRNAKVPPPIVTRPDQFKSKDRLKSTLKVKRELLEQAQPGSQENIDNEANIESRLNPKRNQHKSKEGLSTTIPLTPLKYKSPTRGALAHFYYNKISIADFTFQ